MSFLAAKRYAEALFELAVEAGETASWRAHLRAFADVCADESVARFMRSPKATPADKAALVKRASKGAPPLVANFAQLLAAKNAVALLPHILDVYDELLAVQNENVRVKIYTAEPLSDDLADAVGARLSKLLKTQRLTIERAVAPDIIGGVKVRVGDEVFDGSVAGGFQAIRRQFDLQAL